MKTETLRTGLLASILLATPAMLLAQTTEQQRLNEALNMQRGVYSQDAAGNLDAAIEIYREVAGPRTSDRALAAEAQYRLSQALLQKGDMPAASEALLQLSIQFPDQAERISQLAGTASGRGGRGGGVAVPTLGARMEQGGGRGGGRGQPLPEDEQTAAQLRELERAMVELRAAHLETFETIYDRDFVAGGARTVTSPVENMSWTNPTSWLRVSDGTTTWTLMLPAPNMLLRLGMTRESLPVNEQVTVVLTADASGTPLSDGSLLGRVESIVRVSDGATVFDRAAMPSDQL